MGVGDAFGSCALDFAAVRGLLSPEFREKLTEFARGFRQVGRAGCVA